MITLLKKDCKGEELKNIPQDIYETFSPSFNSLIQDFATDHWGDYTGKFTISITYEPPEEAK